MYKGLDFNAFKAEIDESYTTALASKLPLFKGITSGNHLPDFLFLDPAQHIRPSKTAVQNGNVYNLLLNNLPSWKSGPMRQKSIIATTSLSTAMSFSKPDPNNGYPFGGIYRILPKNMSTFIVSPKPDIWYCFEDSIKKVLKVQDAISLKQFNKFFMEIAAAINVNSKFDLTWESFQQFLTILVQSDKSVERNLGSKAKKLFRKLKDHNTDIVSFLDRMLSPSANNFKTRIYSPHSNLRGLPDNELWTDSACYFVEENVFKSLPPALSH